MSIVASASRRIHQQVSGVTRVSSFAINTRASRRGFQRGFRRPLEEPIPKRVRRRPSQQARQVDNHPVDTHIVVRRHQRWALRPINRLVKRPSAMTRALSLGVPNPNVSEFVAFVVPLGTPRRGGTVGSASAHAEALNCHVSRGQNYIDGVSVFTLWSQLNEVLVGEGFPKRVAFVQNLFVERKGKFTGGFFVTAEVVVFLGGFPPRDDGWLDGLWWRGWRWEWGDEIGDYCLLGRFEVTVPNEVDWDFARKKRAIMVVKKLSRILHQLIQPPWSQRDVEDW